MNPLASIMLRSTLLFACVFSMTLHSTKNISKQIEDADSLLKNSKRSTRLSEKVIVSCYNVISCVSIVHTTSSSYIINNK